MDCQWSVDGISSWRRIISKVKFTSRRHRKNRSLFEVSVGSNGKHRDRKKANSESSSLSLVNSSSLFNKHQIYKIELHRNNHVVDAEDRHQGSGIAAKQNRPFEKSFDYMVKGKKLPELTKATNRFTKRCQMPKHSYSNESVFLRKAPAGNESKKWQLVAECTAVGGKGDFKNICGKLVSTCRRDENTVSVSNKPTKKKTSSKDRKDIYPLQPSLFPNVPPYLNFTSTPGVSNKIPREVRNVLRWKLSNTAPLLVHQIVTRSGFLVTENDSDWVSVWGKNANCQFFKELGENQKVNHFPGTFHLGRKDRLWLNIRRMQILHGKEHFSFMPQTFVLPQHLKQLRSAWVESGGKSRWIIKPPASSRGNGVTVVNRWADVPKMEPVIVQKYVSRPYLINDTKFDLRLYVLVTSFDPLRLYVFTDGLVRFASEKYSRSVKSLGEKFVHLTNYSVNRKNSCYVQNEDESVSQGHKWTLKCLLSYFRQHGIDDRKIWLSLIDVVIKTLISCEEQINRIVRIYAKSRYSCYELFGFDIMLDQSLKPWLLEVNVSPSLHSNSELDIKVKSKLIRDVFNIAGFHIPVEINLNSFTPDVSKRFDIQKGVSWNKDLYGFVVSREERAKQIKFERNGRGEASILKNLSPDDVRQLIKSEDELSRCGSFIRVFPSEISSPYLRFFETPKYYNLLLDAWERGYCSRRDTGILLLQSLCRQGVHLKIGTSYEDKETHAPRLATLRHKIRSSPTTKTDRSDP